MTCAPMTAHKTVDGGGYESAGLDDPGLPQVTVSAAPERSHQ